MFCCSPFDVEFCGTTKCCMVESATSRATGVHRKIVARGGRTVPEWFACGWLSFRTTVGGCNAWDKFDALYGFHFLVVSLASIILWTQLQPSVQSSRASATFCPSNLPSCHHCVTCCDPGMRAIVITPVPFPSSSLVGSKTIWAKEGGGRQLGACMFRREKLLRCVV